MKVTLENDSRAPKDVPGEELERLVEADIQAFDAWFQKQQKEAAAKAGGEVFSEPLVRSERAILKTYLYWKTKGAV